MRMATKSDIIILGMGSEEMFIHIRPSTRAKIDNELTVFEKIRRTRKIISFADGFANSTLGIRFFYSLFDIRRFLIDRRIEYIYLRNVALDLPITFVRTFSKILFCGVFVSNRFFRNLKWIFFVHRKTEIGTYF